MDWVEDIVSTQKKVNIEFIVHRLSSRANSARMYHEVSKMPEEYKEVDISERITSMQELFRDFLELCLNNAEKVVFPKGVTQEHLNKIYSESDFDWTNYDKFKEFWQWYLDYFHNPTRINL